MTTVKNHYAFLGIPENASEADIHSAVARFENPAYALAYTDPELHENFHDLIERIRGDLLSGPARRRAYDRALHPAITLVADGMDIVEYQGETWDPNPPEIVPDTAPGRMQTRALLAGTLATLVVVLLVVIAVQHSGLFSQPSTARVALVSAGAPSAKAVHSGQTVPLRWTPVSGALAYRVQVAVKQDTSRRVVQSRLTDTNSFRLAVVGPRLYLWRVRAGARGTWGPYTSWHAFTVSAPVVQRPTALHARIGRHGAARVAHLCWSPVPGARSYVLAAQGRQRRISGTTCTTVQVRTGRYAWRVAAQVRAAGLYTGPFSTPNRFVVAPPHHVHHTRTHQRRVTHAPAPSYTSSTVDTVPVAVVVPAQSTSNSPSPSTSGAGSNASTVPSGSAYGGTASTTVQSAPVSTPAPVSPPVQQVTHPVGASQIGTASAGEQRAVATIPPPPAPPAIPSATAVSASIPPPPPPPAIP